MAVMKLDGTTQLRFTGDLDLDSNKITNVATPTASGDAANKGYVDSATQALDAKGSVVAASTAAGTLADDFADSDTLDGVTLATGDRILIKDQASAAENGVYVVAASGAPTRATDMDAAGEFAGGFFFVEGGTVNADSGWLCTNNGSVTVDTTSITFEQFTGTGQLTAGAGMTKSANTINVVSGNAGIVANANDITLVADDSSLEVSGSGVQVKNAGVTEAHLNASVAGDGLAGGAGTALSVGVDDSTVELDSDAVRVKADGIKGSHLDQRKEVTSDALASDQWTLSATPFDDDHLMLFFNGQALSVTDDYTRSGATITFLTETGAGDNFLAVYHV